MDLRSLLSEQFNTQVTFRQIRPHTRQILVPLFHEDGDMVDIFLDDVPGSDSIRVCDHGLTMMRLSYDYDVDTPARWRIFQRILRENEVQADDGNLYIDTHANQLYSTIMHFAQVVAKVSNMRVHTKEMVRSMFMEDLQQAILDEMQQYHPEQDVAPDRDRPDLRVDYVLQAERRPIYLFGVGNVDKARIVTITCQALLLNEQRFTSWVVHEDWNLIPNREKAFLTNAVMKQFTSLPEFRVERERFLYAEAL